MKRISVVIDPALLRSVDDSARRTGRDRSAVILIASAATGHPGPASKRRTPCKIPENASTCYWTHGRLSAYNGTPAFRLWKIGTHRLLGISSGPLAEKHDPLDNEHPELPENLQRAFDKSRTPVFGEFEVCPLEPERPGAMHMACIEAATHVVTK